MCMCIAYWVPIIMACLMGEGRIIIAKMYQSPGMAGFPIAPTNVLYMYQAS